MRVDVTGLNVLPLTRKVTEVGQITEAAVSPDNSVS